jgi:hypothetical protein
VEPLQSGHDADSLGVPTASERERDCSGNPRARRLGIAGNRCDTQPDSNLNALRNTESHRHPDRHSVSDADINSGPDAVTNRNPHWNGDGDANANSNTHNTNPDSYSNSDPHANPYSNSDAHAYANAQANADFDGT